MLVTRCASLLVLLVVVATVAMAADNDPNMSGERIVYVKDGWRFVGQGWMNAILLDGPVRLTGWKILGFGGALLFASRWLVQAWHRKRHGNATMPTFFWIMSLSGAAMTTAYFIWGKNDSVGILTNALPATIAAWNLWQDLRARSTA